MEFKNNIRLIALDLDGTLTNSEKLVTERTKAALKQAMEKGVKIVLASGRLPQGIEFIARELEMQERGGYILAYNGGYIADAKSGEILYRKLLDSEFVPELCKFAAKNNVTIATFGEDGTFYSENVDDKWLYEDSVNCRCPLKKVENLAEAVDFPVNKMLVSVAPERRDEVEERMAAQFMPRIDVYHSAPFFIEAMPLGVNKGESLAILLEKLGMTAENLMACGDSGNDLAMIKLAGIGVAMGNAEDYVKEAADFVSADNDHDGVAVALEQFVL